eukprot:jgi/Psemu1/2877/gm1.2877_g
MQGDGSCNAEDTPEKESTITDRALHVTRKDLKVLNDASATVDKQLREYIKKDWYHTMKSPISDKITAHVTETAVQHKRLWFHKISDDLQDLPPLPPVSLPSTSWLSNTNQSDTSSHNSVWSTPTSLPNCPMPHAPAPTALTGTKRPAKGPSRLSQQAHIGPGDTIPQDAAATTTLPTIPKLTTAALAAFGLTPVAHGNNEAISMIDNSPATCFLCFPTTNSVDSNSHYFFDVYFPAAHFFLGTKIPYVYRFKKPDATPRTINNSVPATDPI